MAGKPDLSASPHQQHQQQPPGNGAGGGGGGGVQNVVVYVSNDNFAQAYATVNHQNVATAVACGPPPQMLPKPTKPTSVLKPVDFLDGSGTGAAGFYTHHHQNGFPATVSATAYHTVPVLNNFDASASALKDTTATATTTTPVSAAPAPEAYIATETGFVAVMGADVTGGQNGSVVTFPRCDSVRSETAESSCSSLSSSGDSQVLDNNNGTVQHAITGSDLVMYDNSGGGGGGGNGGMRAAGQSLGNLVLTMVPPASMSVPIQTASTAPPPPVSVPVVAHVPPPQTNNVGLINVPIGWKRITANGIVIYISPSSTALSSLEQVKEYLMTQGTCKCGLECPLKYDAVFNFDPKVIAKPYTLSPDTNIGDLTKLCNHKRKLLAMASLQTSPNNTKPAPIATIPVDPAKMRKDGGIKRKKRKLGSYSGISVSQLLAQREKLALTQQHHQQQIYNKDQTNGVQFSQQQQQQPQQHLPQGWSGPIIPGVNRPAATFIENGVNHQMNPTLPQQFIRYPNQGTATAQINRVIPGSSMMMIPQQQTNLTQHQQIQQQHQFQNQQMIYQQIQQNTNQVNQGQQQSHIISANGQMVNVQHQTSGHLTGQVINGTVNHNAVVTSNCSANGIVLQGQNLHVAGQQQQQRMFSGGQTGEMRNIGRPVIQNNGPSIQQQQQQQDFNQRQQQPQFFNQNVLYQQHQQHQQFDMNKNIRPNFTPNNNNNAVFSGYRTDGMPANTVMLPQNHQMIMMAQPPQQKTVPWQQQQQQQQNKPISSVNNVIMPQNQTVLMPLQQNQNQNNNNVYERVPPLHHHTPPPPVWNEDLNRKKVKMSKLNKKQRSYNLEHQQRSTTSNDQNAPCPNIDVRQIPVESNKSTMQQYQQNSAGPSFMDDPSGYLAQQTALLNSTISRQTGANNCANYMCHSPSGPHPQNANPPIQNNMLTLQMKQAQVFNNRMNNSSNNNNNNNQNNMSIIKIPVNSQTNHLQQQQYNHVLQNNLPDSSAIVDAGNAVVQCQGCVGASDLIRFHDPNYNGGNNNKQQIRIYQQSQSRPNSQPSTPNSGSQSDDNPVTSSTFMERNGIQSGYVPSPDSRPIQGGTISTSNGSPIDCQNQSEPSPNPSTPTPTQQQQRNSDTPLMNVIVSNSPSFSISNSSYSSQIPIVTSSVRDSGLNNNNTIQSPSVISGQNSTGLKLDGYCPHPHTNGSSLNVIPRLTTSQIPYSIHSGMITTMASGRTVGHNTITSVLAGRASTATVSINSPATVPVTSATPNSFNNNNNNNNNNQANALITAAAIPSQSLSLNVTKSPLEMVQSVVSSIQIPPHSHSNQQQILKHSPTTQALPPGHIFVSSGGQLLMASTGTNGHGIMAPPPPKLTTNGNAMPPLSASPMITNVTGAVTQVIPAVGVAQQVLGQQTVLVNALPTPFVIQPGVVTVDGMTVGQNMQIPHLVTGNVIQQQIQIDGNQDIGHRTQHHSPGFVGRQTAALLSPESNKKKGKKRKISSQTVASMLHIASQQNSGVVMQQPQQSFQMSHSPQGLTTGPIMQALTIVPGKAGVSPQIVMNGQPTTATGAFGAQQLITNSQPAPQINLLQPVNLLNGATGVVQNFPTIQQFIVPNLGSMVMAADGTATLVQDTSNIGMQLQLQNVNGQNVLTPVQNTSNMFNQGQSILAAGPAGMVIRTPGTNQNKIIQQQHSPGAAQFLSSNGGQFLMNGAQFNGQLSPLIANVSPTQQVTFSTAPQAVRPNTSVQQQEFIQCGQMGQTLMVPCAPAQAITVTTASSQQNTTFVHQNTTIVQQQTTMVSNNPIQNFAATNNNNNHANQNNNNTNNNQNAQNITESTTTLNVDQNFVINNSHTVDNKQQQQHHHHQQSQPQMQSLLIQRQSPQSAAMLRHSVSTQTAANQKMQASAVTTNTFCQTSMASSAGSPPDTTTHSPLAPGGQSPANADTTTHSIGTGSTDEGLSPSPSTGSCTDLIAIQARQQASSMAMVHCISSSEPDSGDLCGPQSDIDWSRNGTTNFGYKSEYDLSGGGLSVHIARKPDTPTHMAYVESSSTVVSGMHFVAESMKTQESVVSSRHYEKSVAALKRKHSDTLVVMETRHMHASLQDDEDGNEEVLAKLLIKKDKSIRNYLESTVVNKDVTPSSKSFVVGDLVWGPAHGCPSWPGKLVEISNDGRTEGKVCVRWFGGDKTPTEVHLSALQTLSEGLDAHHRARKKCRKSRKLNSQLENAIQEAMSDLDRMSVDQKQSKTIKIQPKNHLTTTATTFVKGEIAGRLRSSQR